MRTKFWLESLKGSLGRHRRRWEDINMDLREIEWEEDVDWIHLVQDRD
jgi:hypothetical protein